MDDSLYVAKGDFVYRDGQSINISQATGVSLTSSDGRYLFDAEAANGTASLGYDSDIIKMATTKISNLPNIPSFLETNIRLSYATKLGKIFERDTGSEGMLSFDLGGAQGIELALKIANLNTSGTKIFVLEGGYHGRSIFTSQLSCSQRYRDPCPAIFPDIVRLPNPEIENNILDMDPKSACKLVKRLAENIIDNELCGNGGGHVAPMAIIIEPLLNVSGLTMPDSDYLREIVSIIKSRGGIVIVDEIFTGMYRSGKRWGFMLHDLKPDIVVASKALTNGIIPLSVVWMRSELGRIESFPPGTHSITFGNTPLTFAIATTVLDIFESSGIDDMFMSGYEEKLKTCIVNGTRGSSEVKNVQVIGATARIKLNSSNGFEIRNRALTTKIGKYDGFLFAATGLSKDTLALHPPLVLKDEHFESLEKAIFSLLH